ncbi:hypothetical protein KY289_013692 [Solanum tuberosum]|nr:hypothetical protein KY289_013692 [Solanum tuberosum]
MTVRKGKKQGSVLNEEEKIGGLPVLDTSKGNPGPSSTTFCVRDYNGTLVGAKGVKLVDSSNLMAEAIAIRKGNYEFNSFHEVPTTAKKIINLEKCNSPYIRIKQTDSPGTDKKHEGVYN